jgi:hypothetical protein
MLADIGSCGALVDPAHLEAMFNTHQHYLEK